MENELQITTTDRAILEDRGTLFEDEGVILPKGTLLFPKEVVTTFSSGDARTLRRYQLPAPHFLEVTFSCYRKEGKPDLCEMSIPTEGLLAFTTSQNTSSAFLQVYLEYSNSCNRQTWSNEYSDFPSGCTVTVNE